MSYYLLFSFLDKELPTPTLLTFLGSKPDSKTIYRLTTFGKQSWWLADPIDLHIQLTWLRLIDRRVSNYILCIDPFVFTTARDSVLYIQGLGWRKPPHSVEAESLCDVLTTISLKRSRRE